MTAEEIIRLKAATGAIKELLYVLPYQTVYFALRLMQTHDVSQLPVLEDDMPVGAVYEDSVLKLALQGKDLRKVLVREIMGRPFPIVPANTSIHQLTHLLTSESPAIFVDVGGRYEILTKYDLVAAVARLAEKESRD